VKQDEARRVRAAGPAVAADGPAHRGGAAQSAEPPAALRNECLAAAARWALQESNWASKAEPDAAPVLLEQRKAQAPGGQHGSAAPPETVDAGDAAPPAQPEWEQPWCSAKALSALMGPQAVAAMQARFVGDPVAKAASDPTA
jgi:hypothetical protein